MTGRAIDVMNKRAAIIVKKVENKTTKKSDYEYMVAYFTAARLKWSNGRRSSRTRNSTNEITQRQG